MSRQNISAVKNSFRNPTAGVLYHWRAFRYRKQWQPFRSAVENWLNEWLPPESPIKTIVLIGPNAGYTLPARFIGQFGVVVGVDLDAAAQVLFQARFMRPVQWISRDYFGLELTPPNPAALEELFSAFPHAGFLFCNILGQLPVLLRDRRDVNVDAYMLKLGQVLERAGRRYKIASYHDRFSRDLKKPTEAIDHMTGHLFSNWPIKKEFPWRLTSRLEHQVEFVGNQVTNQTWGEP